MHAAEESCFLSFDKTPIRYEWREASGSVRKSSILIVHGAGEHGGRYAEFTTHLAEHGFTTYTPDLRGHGKSGGERAYVKDFSDYVRDLLALAEKIQKDSSKPLFLMGHSMGGLIAATCAADWPTSSSPRGVVLSSPFFGVGFVIPNYLKLIAKLTAKLNPRFRHKTLVQPEALTHDAEVIKRYRQDSLMTRFVTSGQFAAMSLQAAKRDEISKKITCPTLIVQAGDDRIVDAKLAEIFFGSLAASDKELKLYPGLYHEILNETPAARNAVYADITNWLTQHVS